MECPACQGDAGESRVRMLWSARLSCRACGERLFAMDGRSSMVRVLLLGGLWLGAAVLIAYGRVLESKSMDAIYLKVAIGMTLLFASSRFLRTHRLVPYAEVSAETLRANRYLAVANGVMIASFYPVALSESIGEGAARRIQLALFAIAIGLLATARPERV